MPAVDKNNAYAYLSIDGFTCSVAELTKRIGLQPTEAWNVGDLVPPPRFPRKFSAWRIRTRLRHSEEVERHIVDVLDQIRGYETVVRDVARDYQVRMPGVGYYNEFNLGFRLNADILRRIAECGMIMDLDVYQFFQGKDDEVEHDA